MKAQKAEESIGKEEKGPSLKGTLISVSALGIFIVLSWLGAFLLFIGR
ncbi:cytochrome c oxidase subunit 2A [Virgibacillus sediminis]|uniref:Cytochrome c oxidase subunit 2A n=1 Tax=Virgibacillus sediminis TaxID=202260 RepID=A0ABV7A7W5_9BACI